MGEARTVEGRALVSYALGTKASLPCSACSLVCLPCFGPTLIALATILAHSSWWLSIHKDSSLISYPGLL